MNFLNVILQNSNVKEAKLYPAAKRASENPALGITIQNEAAYHVIKDCANITQLYLPHFVFSSYQEPFKTLSRKFKKEDIIEFVNTCNSNPVLNQLLEIILYKIQQQTNKNPEIQSSRSYTSTSDDPYGDYALYVEDAVPTEPSPIKLNPIDALCQAFNL